MKRYDFDAGLPDADAYPVAELRRYFDQVLRLDAPATLNYTAGSSSKDMTYGHGGLRQAIAEWLLENEGCDVSEDQVLLASGSMNGISMTVNALVGPGDAAVVESVSYPYARQFMEVAGATVFTVPVDGDGMDVDRVAERFAEAKAAGLRPRLLYTVSTFHSPTGTVLSLDRRRQLVELARQWEFTVLDDSAYSHLYFDEPPPPSLLHVADGGPVVQSATFSKYVAPGLRMAWLVGPEDLIATIAGRRQDVAVSQLTARVLEAYVRDGHLDEHLVDLRRLYRAKRDVAAAALEKHCAPWVRFVAPGGGFYFWLEIDERVDYEAALARAAALGVGFRPGTRFLNADTGTRHLRLSVAQLPEAEIEAGIALLGQALAGSVTSPA
jgi:2-aminoadipate transaminase